MRWNCPHCGTSLAAADPVASNPAELSASWKLFSCYKCGGFSMRNALPQPAPSPTQERDPNRPPPFRKASPRILQAHRAHGQAVAGATPTRAPILAPRTEPAPGQESTADFSVLRGHLRLDERKQSTPVPARRILPHLKPAPTFRNRFTIRQGVLGLLVVLTLGAGGLLYRQGEELERLSRAPGQQRQPESDGIEDRIEIRAAAPRRAHAGSETDENKSDTHPKVEVDLSEPGMRYEILNRSAR